MGGTRTHNPVRERDFESRAYTIPPPWLDISANKGTKPLHDTMSAHFPHMKKLWFKAKEYGWGWYPATREGWAVTFGYIALMMIPPLLFDFKTHTAKDVYIFLIPIWSVLTAVMIYISYKTGEKPRWRWGN